MFNEEYKRLKELVEENLERFLPERIDNSASVLDAMKYSLNAGGKRIRPVMLIASCKIAGGKEEDALPFACAMEFIHTYSLIHDDLPAMDDDELRRGKPTNHIVFGEACAILAGDALLNSAFEVMLEAVAGCSNEKRDGMIKAAKCIANAAGYNGMIGGQIADIEGENSGKRDLDTLGFIHKNKTGALIKSAVLAGAYIGGASEEIEEDLSQLGDLIGLGFQIADDILDVCGTVEELGKPIGSDDKNGKLTYPSLVGMEETKKIYEEVHGKTVLLTEKLGQRAEFFRDLARDLYYRTV